MTTHYHIQELANGLRIHAGQERELWERLFASGIVAAVIGFATATLLGRWWWCILSAIAAVGVFQAVRSRNAELQVTNVEFITRGDLGQRVQTPRVVCTGDVCRLEFRGDIGPITSNRDGLYALTERKELCLLPFLDWKQTKQVIHAIENKFPGLGEIWRSRESIGNGVNQE
jgi:hypothetical protein